MTDHHPYPMLYASGSIKVADHLLNEVSLPVEVHDFLMQYGLPMLSTKNDNTIAPMQFCEPFMHSIGKRQWFIIAREEWSEGLLIGLDLASFEVCRLEETSNGRPAITVLNRSLFCFLDFMEQLLVFVAKHPLPEYEAQTYTAEEAAEKLAAWRERQRTGQSIQRTPEQEERIRMNRQLEQQFQAGLRQLKQSFRQTDAIAMKRNSWWKVVLEQLEDGII